MNTNNKLGMTLINGMKKLNLKQAKNLMLASFSLYKNMILANQEIPPSPWFHFHDLVALMWGYYGDLDLHYEKMEIRLIKQSINSGHEVTSKCCSICRDYKRDTTNI